MGKPMGQHLNPITLSPKTQKGPKKGSSFHDFRFALHSIFDKLSKSQKWSNMTKCSLKLGQGTTGHQHSPVTHPQSLRFGQIFLKGLDLGSSCFDLSLCYCFLLCEFLNNLFTDRSFQLLLNYDNYLL